MGFYDELESVNQYIEMVQDYDNTLIMEMVDQAIPPGSKLLEIGIGPGKDFDSLKEKHICTGSDYSQIFLDKYRANNSKAKLLLLDAVTLETDETFDAIFSNKVLHHLSPEQLSQSFEQQERILNDGGIIFHTFWYGQGKEEMMGLVFNYYIENDLKAIIGDRFQILDIHRYQEEELDDSIVLVMKK